MINFFDTELHGLSNEESGSFTGFYPLICVKTIAVTEGGLDFGPWEQIIYGIFDGRRKKRILVKIIGA